MSDYVHEQCILYPIGEKECETIDKMRKEGALEGFEVDCFYDDEAAYFLKYVLYNSYGESSGEFGASRFLNEKEKEFWTDKFAKVLEIVGAKVDPEKLKYCDYCYYNCCEAPDYYNDSCLDVDTIEMFNTRKKD